MAVSQTEGALDQRGAHIFEACCVASQGVAIEFDAHLIFACFAGAMDGDYTEFGLYYESGRAVLRPEKEDSILQVGLTFASDHDLGCELQCYAVTSDKREVWDIGNGPEFMVEEDLWVITYDQSTELLSMLERVAKAAAKSYATQEPLT